MAAHVPRSHARGDEPVHRTAIGRVGLSDASDVAAAVAAASSAFPAWAATPLKERVGPLRRFHELVSRNADDLANTVRSNRGKTPAEALAGIQRGLEVVEYALSLPNLDDGAALEVSRGVTCEARREPLGVVAGITPFNFPAMVPMWMFPIALTLGNAFVLKPSEKVPLTACRLGELMTEAGYAPGLFSVVHGDRETVQALVDHPDVRAVAFVGSTPVARGRLRARDSARQARALPRRREEPPHRRARRRRDAHRAGASSTRSPAARGSAAWPASVLVVVGARGASSTRSSRRPRASSSAPGWAPSSTARRATASTRAIAKAEAEGAEVLLDGRSGKRPPRVRRRPLDRRRRSSIACARTWSARRPSSSARCSRSSASTTSTRRSRSSAPTPYGNATSVFTSSGAVARYVAERAASGMIGVNVGVPVPRDPFSFGGTKDSRFGHGDITGPGALELWSQLKKITTRWAPSPDATWMS